MLGIRPIVPYFPKAARSSSRTIDSIQFVVDFPVTVHLLLKTKLYAQQTGFMPGGMAMPLPNLYVSTVSR